MFSHGRFLLILAVILVGFIYSAGVNAQGMSVEGGEVGQIQVLSEKVDLQNQINNRILDTIYWALGGLITVFLAIIGLNFGDYPLAYSTLIFPPPKRL